MPPNRELDRLYGLPRTEYTSARNALVRDPFGGGARHPDLECGSGSNSLEADRWPDGFCFVRFTRAGLGSREARVSESQLRS